MSAIAFAERHKIAKIGSLDNHLITVTNDIIQSSLAMSSTYLLTQGGERSLGALLDATMRFPAVSAVTLPQAPDLMR